MDIDPGNLARHWQKIAVVLGLLETPTSKVECEKRIAALDQLLEYTKGNSGHTLAPLIEMLGDAISAYESQQQSKLNATTPAEVLKLLMESNGLKQKDLADLFGGQSVVSEVLAGKRDISAKQARKLGERFSVPLGVFIDPASDAHTSDAAGVFLSLRDVHAVSTFPGGYVIGNVFKGQSTIAVSAPAKRPISKAQHGYRKT